MRDLPQAVMIFAAGFGTRMQHLTRDRPKPLIEVAGVPLIDHTLALVRSIEPSAIVANLHYKAQQMERHLASQGVGTVHEFPDILDTGGGLRNALPALGNGPVFTVNSDAIWSGPNPLNLLLEAWDSAEMDALMMCVPVENAVGSDSTGDFTMDGQGRLRRGAGWVYGGLQIIKTDSLESFEQGAFSLNLVWDQMLDRNRLHGLSYPGRWCDVGHPGGIALAEAVLRGDDV